MAAKDFTRFESKIERVPFSGCWLWTGAPVRGGYGLFQISHRPNKKCESAHRYSWRLYRGEIPEGLKVLHRCDVPACVNPDHLFLGTQAENVADMCRKGRHSTQPCHTKIRREDVDAIRAAYEPKRYGLVSRLANKYGVSITQIHRIVSGRSWK